MLFRSGLLNDAFASSSLLLSIALLNAVKPLYILLSTVKVSFSAKVVSPDNSYFGSAHTGIVDSLVIVYLNVASEPG